MTSPERRERTRRLAWLHAVADPYTYRLPPAEKRRLNAEGLRALEAMDREPVIAAHPDDDHGPAAQVAP